ncbi:hypothetical protein C0J52_22466 [Blattella germanica]|nr:hypothetical protein C0J52_22466 [Blattella germanica]
MVLIICNTVNQIKEIYYLSGSNETQLDSLSSKSASNLETYHSSHHPQATEISFTKRKIYLNMKPEMKLKALHSLQRLAQQDASVLANNSSALSNTCQNESTMLNVPEQKTDTRYNRMYINPRFLGNSGFQTTAITSSVENVKTATTISTAHANPKVTSMENVKDVNTKVCVHVNPKVVSVENVNAVTKKPTVHINPKITSSENMKALTAKFFVHDNSKSTSLGNMETVTSKPSVYVNPKVIHMENVKTVNTKPSSDVKLISMTTVTMQPLVQASSEKEKTVATKPVVHVNPKVFARIMKSNSQTPLISDAHSSNVINKDTESDKLITQPSAHARKYIYCSKTKLVKKDASQHISTNKLKPSSIQFVPKIEIASGSLMSVSRTKLVRAPVKSRRTLLTENKIDYSSPTANSSSKLKVVKRPSVNSEVIRISRTKFVRMPAKQRKENIQEAQPIPNTSSKSKHISGSITPPLISLSKTKLIRSPMKQRQLSFTSNKSFSTGSLKNKIARKQSISPTLVSISRTTMIRSPMKIRSSSSSSVTKEKDSGKLTVSPSTYPRTRKSSASTSNVTVKVAKAICSKYKFNKTSPRYPTVRNSRYKIDRRREKIRLKKVNKYSVRYSTQKNESQKPFNKFRRPTYSTSYKFGNLTWSKSFRPKKVMVMDKKLMRIGSSPVLRNKEERKRQQSLCLVQIGGVLYKTSKLKLTKSQINNKSTPHVASQYSKFKKTKKNSSLIVSVRGNKFLMDPSGKKLVKMSQKQMTEKETISPVKRIDIGGVTFIQKSKNVLIRTNTHTARNVVSQAKQKSIAMLTNKLRKTNQPCMFYHRFGKCSRKETGTCPYLHDPKQVAICKKFLQGCCEMNCTLSHDVGPEKMPTCKYFLEGCCVRENCPYLHVKVNAKAAICKNFLRGYCSDGTKRHTFLCPDFDKTGNCPKGKYCQYPHTTDSKKKTKKRVVVKKKEHKAPVPKEVKKRYYETSESTVTGQSCENRPVDSNDVDNKNPLEIQSENPSMNQEGTGSEFEAKRLKLLKKVNDMKRNWLAAQSGADVSSLTLPEPETESLDEPFIKRPKLGRLPSYIPLTSDSEKRHTFLCPDFDKTGNCPKGKYCQYPHTTDSKKKTKKRVVVKKKEHKAPVPKEVKKRYYETSESTVTGQSCENRPVDSNDVDNKNPLEIQSENPSMNQEGTGSEFEVKRLKLLKKVNDMKRNWLAAQSGADVSSLTLPEPETESLDEPFIKRPKLGRLPSYIPLTSDSE